MKARKDNWVHSERVAPKHGEPVWIAYSRGCHNFVVTSATYQVTDDEDVPEGFFWELPGVNFIYGHRYWQPRFDGQPLPTPPL